MDRPLVSILIPAYNHELFVEQCLDSVLADPYPNKELVIINDGSTDDTARKIDVWAERNTASVRIDYVSRANKGVSATLNELAMRANGEFLRLGASDDYFLPGGTEAQVKYLQANARKLAVIGDTVVVDHTGRTIYGSAMAELHRVNKAHYRSDDSIRREIISRWAVGGPAPMIRRHAVESIGGWDEDLRIDDWSLFLRLAAIDALGFIDVKVGAYRIHDNNTCRTDDTEARIANLHDAATVARKHVALFDEPCKSLLRAQSHLISAKVAYLERRPVPVVTSILRFLLLSAAAGMKGRGAARGKAVL